MKPIKAVIFDWAGTTVDYGCMAPIHAMSYAFSKAKLTVSLPDIRKPMGMLKVDHIKAILEFPNIQKHFMDQYQRRYTEQDVQAIYNSFEQSIFKTLDDHATLIPGILYLQEFLRNKKIKIGTTTGYTQKMLAIVANKAKEQGYEPDANIASDQVKQGRPYPHMIRRIMEELAVNDSQQVVKVGDTLVDIQEGLQAGCFSVGVIQGSSMMGLTENETAGLSPSELKHKMSQVKHAMLDAGAHAVIDSIGELSSIVSTI